MKKLTMALALSASVLTLTACNSDSETVVESEAGNITKEEFYNELKANNGEQILQQMVTVKVLEDKYEVADEDVDKEIDKMKEQYEEQYGEGYYDMIVEQQFGGEEAFRDIVYVSLLQEQAAAEDTEITEEELKERYERSKQEIEAQHILVEDEETAKEIKEKLDNGEKFEELAKEYSTDTASAQDGGKLDTFSAGFMIPEFEDAVYTMEVGEISDPVATEFGYHIIKLNERKDKEEDIGDFEDVKEDLRRDLVAQKMDSAKLQEKINKLIEDANIDIKIEGMEDLFTPANAEEAQG